MASRDRDEEKGFLSRWSQRKRAAEAVPAEGEEKRLDEGAVPSAADPAQGPLSGGADGKIDPADLPDIESLDANSDFTVFLKEGVPDALRRRALRKLWRLDPVFGHLDGLNDYDLDYTSAATVVEGLKTVYQVGKGIVLGEDEKEKRPAEEGAGESPGENTAEAPASDEEESPEAEMRDRDEEGPEVPAPEAVPAAPPGGKRKTRNPGDPLVSDTATRRRAAARPPRRSALRRRWGDSDG